MLSRLQDGHGVSELESRANQAAAEVLQMPTGTDVPSRFGRSEAPIRSQPSLGSTQGRSLSRSMREYFEPRFGAPLGSVRVHTSDEADVLAASVGARAFTHGRDIFVSGRERALDSARGRKLLAHELAHVVQQRHNPSAPTLQKAEVDSAEPVGTMARGLTFLSSLLGWPFSMINIDSSSLLNTKVNTEIAAARTAVGLSSPPTEAERLNVALETFNRLGAPFVPFLAIIEDWANSNLMAFGGGLTTRAKVALAFSGNLKGSLTSMGQPNMTGNKYENASGPFLDYLSPVVNLGGHFVGTDKIGHMFQQGFQYFGISLPASQGGLGQGDAGARAWGEWTEGELSSATASNKSMMTFLKTKPFGIGQGGLGLDATGVHSRGDLAANESGLQFYKDLFADPMMTFDIATYITADWDEEVSGNIYEKTLGAAVKSAGRLNSVDKVLP